jgi:hypothetical protein
MFYIWNAAEWLEEVISVCSENNLDPEESVFVLMLFSSLDFDYVAFFRDKKPQISQYSGKNVHLFTPLIYDSNVVPDDEWRFIREGFERAGVRIGNRPSCILFQLKKRDKAAGYDPHYLAAFGCPSFDRFSEVLRDFVDVCIAHRRDPDALTRKLGLLLHSENLARAIQGEHPLSHSPVTGVLHAPRAFISYAHEDKTAVMSLYESLKEKRVKLWLDQVELSPGARFQEEIEHALHACDAILVVLSKNSSRSNWVPFEGAFFYAQGATKLIVPIVLDDEGRERARALPFLKDRLYIDFADEAKRNEGVAKLAAALSDARRDPEGADA